MSQQIFGAAAAVIALNRAFNDESPANAVFQNQVAVAQADAANGFANFAKAFSASFAGLSNAALAAKVMDNMGLLPNPALESALVDYLNGPGASNRGLVVLQLATILSGLEAATGNLAVYNAAAAAWNAEVTTAYAYSANPAHTVPSGTVAPVPTYELSSSANSVNEGASVVFHLDTTNVAPGTTYSYVLSGVSAQDVVGGALSGNVTVDAQGKAAVTVGLVADATTEGAEALTMTLAGKAASVVVNDTSLTPVTPVPTYALSSSVANVDEGASVLFNLDTTNVAPGTELTYTLSGVSTQDVVGGALTGTVKVDAQGKAAVNVALVADATTEGAETLTMTLAGKTASVVVNDTSLTPRPPIELTLGIDDVTGTAQDDVFVANDAAGTITLTTFDKVDGGAGVDTLRMDVNTSVASLSPYDGVVKGIEKAIINAQGTITGNVSAWQGLEDLVTSSKGDQTITAAANLKTMTLVNDPGVNGDITVNGGGGVLKIVTGTGSKADTSAVSVGATAVASGFTSVSVTGGNTVTINDRSGAGATLAAVALDGNVGAANVTANGLTTLSLSNLSNNADATVTAAAGTRDLSVTLNNVNSNDIEVRDDTATSFSVTTAGTAADVVDTLHFHAATQGTVTANGAATLNATEIHLANGASTLNIAGDARVTINTLEGKYNSGLVINSSNTAGVTIATELGTEKTFQGGAGADDIKLGATTKVNTLGGGNDSVALSVGALGAGGAIDGGAGYDTLSMSAVNAATLTATATNVTGFEQLNIGLVANGATNVIELGKFNAAGNNVAYVKSAGVGSLNPVVTEQQTITVNNNATSGGSIALSIAGVPVTVTVASGQTPSQIAASIATAITAAVGTSLSNIVTAATSNASVVTVTFDASQQNASQIACDENVGGTSVTVADNTRAYTPATSGLIIKDLASGGTFELTGNNQGAVTLNVVDGVGDESVNLKLSSADALTGGTVNAAGVENVAITTVDTNALTHVDTLSLVDAAAKSITVAGNAGLNLTFAGTALTSFDASGVTNGAVTWTTGALASAATIKGGNAGNTINFAAATKAVTFTGGAGVDTVTATNNANNFINTGNGNDVVSLGAGKNTVDLGDGNDSVTLGSGQNVLTLGAGNDNVVLVKPVNGNSYSTILDIAKGDTLQFVNQGVETFVTANIALPATAAFQDYLDAATAGDAATNGSISWFQYGGDTYVVEDLSAQTTFQNGNDIVIKLAGLVDLSTATNIVAATGTHVLTIA